jgi:DNA-binding GntR family transcriptional regulator
VLARIAARNFHGSAVGGRLNRVLQELRDRKLAQDRSRFSAMRREFYRTLLEIGGNRELQRHFATIQMQIIYVQFEAPDLYEARMTDYNAIGEAVLAGDVRKAEDRARRHVRHVRKIIRGLRPESEAAC